MCEDIFETVLMTMDDNLCELTHISRISVFEVNTYFGGFCVLLLLYVASEFQATMFHETHEQSQDTC